jgi:hypothetical protein
MRGRLITKGVGAVVIGYAIATVTILPVTAADQQGARASLSRTYNASGTIPTGSLVGLSKVDGDTVELSDTVNGDRLLGVRVQPNAALLAVDTQSSVEVALSGAAEALVSDINGAIVNGDPISVSPVRGVGMKADPGLRIIGVARAAFSAGSKNAVKKTIHDTKGNPREITLGSVAVTITGGYSQAKPSSGESAADALQGIAASVVGHRVDAWRLAVAAVVGAATLVAVVALAFGTIRGTIVAVGRNPLAQGVILKALSKVIGLTVFIVLFSLLVQYLLLR